MVHDLPALVSKLVTNPIGSIRLSVTVQNDDAAATHALRQTGCRNLSGTSIMLTSYVLQWSTKLTRSTRLWSEKVAGVIFPY